MFRNKLGPRFLKAIRGAHGEGNLTYIGDAIMEIPRFRQRLDMSVDLADRPRDGLLNTSVNGPLQFTSTKHSRGRSTQLSFEHGTSVNTSATEISKKKTQHPGVPHILNKYSVIKPNPMAATAAPMMHNSARAQIPQMSQQVAKQPMRVKTEERELTTEVDSSTLRKTPGMDDIRAVLSPGVKHMPHKFQY